MFTEWCATAICGRIARRDPQIPSCCHGKQRTSECPRQGHCRPTVNLPSLSLEPYMVYYLGTKEMPMDFEALWTKAIVASVQGAGHTEVMYSLVICTTYLINVYNLYMHMFRSCVSLVLGYLQKQETIILREGSIRQPLGLKSSPLINHFSTPQRTVDSASNFNQPKSSPINKKIASLLFTWLRAPPAVHAAANLLLWYTSDIFSACLANGEILPVMVVKL